ncbi:MAG TPA: helix-turn-helix domain-containing protein [Pseudonocardiaceae bacterium]|nr:helix-turn-helix domain-containing protein [Pseudonocardiaceae bacterium]
MNARRQQRRQPKQDVESAELRQSEVAMAAAEDAGRLDPTLLGDFLDRLADAQLAPTWDQHQQAAFEALGARAVDQGASLPDVVDLYLSAAWRVWPTLPAVGASDAQTVRAAGSAVLHVVDDAVAAVATGFVSARRAMVRREESLRREFVDDLLSGTADPAGLLVRADGYGLNLAGDHQVIVASAAHPFRDATPVLSEVAAALRTDHFVATRDGLLVAVVAVADDAAVAAVTAAVHERPDARIAVGRRREGPAGVARSFADAKETLGLAERMGWPERVVAAERTLVYQVLLRDRAALDDLIESVLAPLRDARGGARPLLDTVFAYCETGGNVTATASRLHLSPRAVSYRLERVGSLTGWQPSDPSHRYVLHTAVLGARAVGWH